MNALLSIVSRPSSVLVFSEDPVLNAYWWAQMFGINHIRRLPMLAVLKIDEFEIAFCPPDTRNSPGGSPVVYWWALNFNVTRFHLRDWDCIELHYPIENPDGTQMTQFRDPFGVIFGIQGPVSNTDPVWPDANLRAF